MKQKHIALFFTSILILITSFFVERFFSVKSYSLNDLNVKLVNLKTKTDFVPLMGANEFFEHSNSLHRDRINLHMWHGHQYIGFDKAKNITFELEQTSKSIIDLTLYNSKNATYKILRLDRENNTLKSISSKHNGKFSEQKLIASKINATNRIKFSSNGLSLNDELVISTDDSFELGVRLDSEAKTYLRNLNVDGAKAKLKPAYSPIYILGSFLFLLAVLFFLNPMAQVTSALVVSVLAGAFYYSFLTFAHHTYPQYDLSRSTALVDKEFEEDFVNNETSRTAKLLKQKKNGVLFLGSSQTFGEGASHISRRWTTQFCLNQRIKNCTNLGIRSATSHTFLKLNSEIIKSRPKTIFYSLAFNDGNPAEHMKNTKKLVQSWKDEKIEVILILEPNRDKYNYLHQNLENIGKLLKVKVINMQTAMERSKHLGWLWWDKIHLTDFGHETFAKLLIDIISRPTNP